MEPKRALALGGFMLLVVGVLFMAAQFIWVEHFAFAVKELSGWGIDLKTNVPGFGVMVLGTVLLLAARFGKLPNSN
jgi:hypothetical protein